MRRLRLSTLFALSLAALAVPAMAFAQASVSVTGPTPINQCEANGYTITVSNPAGATTDVEAIVVTNTMPPTGLVYLAGSTTITSPSGVDNTDPGVVGQVLTWDIDAIYGSAVVLTPGDDLTIDFTMETDCTAVGGTDQLSVAYTGTGSPRSDNFFITVKPGDISLYKTPANQPASIGDAVTWTLKVRSTGLGDIQNVRLTDTLGTGMSWSSLTPAPAEPAPYPSTVTWSSTEIPALATMAVDDEVTITAVADVDACTDLTNDFDATFGCIGLGQVPDQTCLDTSTEVPPGTASAAIDYVLRPPDISVTIGSMEDIPYCSDKTVSVTITNGDPVTPDPDVGGAYSFVLDLDGLPSGYEITNVTGGVIYTPATGEFTIGDIAANSEISYTFDINWQTGACPPSGGGVTLWQSIYDDECGNPFAPPVQIKSVSLTGLPSLSITKNDPGIVNGNDTITFTVQVEYDGPDGFTPTITDDYPNPTPGWTIQNITGGGVDDGNAITWTPTLNDGDTWSESFEMTLSDPCAGPPEGLYVNIAAVTGGTDCRGCTISGDSQTVTFAVEDTPGCDGDCNLDGSRSGGGTAEVCTNISYTNTYALSGSSRPGSWAGSTMTDDMVLGQTYVSLDAVRVDGMDYSSSVSDNAGAGGTYIVDLSGLDSAPGCPAPDAAFALVVEYTFQAEDTTGSQYDESVLTIATCSSEVNWILVNVERTSLGLGLSGPSLTDRCGIETYTMSLTKNIYDVYDLLVIFDLDPDGDGTNNYEYVAGTTVFTGTFTESGAGAITAFEPDTGTPGELRWDFATQGGGSGDLSAVGSIEIDLRMPCSAGLYTYAAEAQYNDRCDDGSVPRESTVTAGPDQPMYIAEANAFIMKGPEQNYADQTPVTWTLTVTNGGDGAAYNLVVTDTLDADLSYNSSSVTPASVVPAPPAGGNVIVWDFASLVAPLDDLEDLDGDGQYDDLTPGGQVSFTITADIIGCDDLDNEVYAEWGCLSGTCQTSATDYSEVLLPPDGLVGVATFPGTIALCGTGDVVIEVKNSGQTNLYNLYVEEVFPLPNPPSGAFYQAGTAEYRHYDSSTSTWSGWTGISDPSGSGTEADPYVYVAGAVPAGIPEFNDLPIEDIVEIRYEILTDCDFVTSDRKFRTTAGYDSVCDEAQVTDETEAILLIQDMNVSVLKEGRIGTSGTFQEAELYAVNGDTVEWRVTLNSTGAAAAQNASLSDQYPADVDYVSTVSGTPPDSVSGGPGGETLTWNASTVMSNDGGVDPNLLDGTFQVILRGTVIGCTSPSCNEATAEWGCNAGGTCISGSNSDSQCLVLQPDLAATTNNLAGFTTCNGTITFTVTNDGARAEALDVTYTLPSGYLYDSSAGGAEITSSVPAHTFTEPEEEPVDLGGSPQQIEFASVANGGNINNGNDYVDPGETLTVTFNVYRDPSSGQCDSDPSSVPPPPPNATGTASGTYEDTCGGGPNAITFPPDTEAVAYPDLDITVIPSTQVVPDGGTATFNVTLRNNGTSTADNWTATHTLSAGYSSINSTLGSVVGQQVIFAYTDAGGGAILPSTQRTYVITADVGTGSLVHDYQVVGPCQNAGGSVTGCDYSYDGDSVYSANFDDAKTPDTQTATIGETVTFTVTGEFQNPTYSNLVITDTLPTPGLEYITHTIVSGPTPSFTEPSPGVLRFDYGTISSSTTIQIDIDARVDDDAVNFAGATQTN
ncbi:MAG: hypothetical protein P9M00_09725, partial [Candidatus Tritonobacter lacicola]|nr:hypothetical protein [Candidatus Tritonobacter lacicola]